MTAYMLPILGFFSKSRRASERLPAECLPKTKTGNHIFGQLIRSGRSPAPNYGEAQSAESWSDFIHKMKISFKELRGTRIWLLMIVKGNLIKAIPEMNSLIAKNSELIAMFVGKYWYGQTERRRHLIVQPRIGSWRRRIVTICWLKESCEQLIFA